MRSTLVFMKMPVSEFSAELIGTSTFHPTGVLFRDFVSLASAISAIASILSLSAIFFRSCRTSGPLRSDQRLRKSWPSRARGAVTFLPLRSIFLVYMLRFGSARFVTKGVSCVMFSTCMAPGHVRSLMATDLEGLQALRNNIGANLVQVDHIATGLFQELAHGPSPVTLIVAAIDLLRGQAQTRHHGL